MCCGREKHTIRPPIAPAVCMLVESSDGERVLLVRARNSRFAAGVVTCPTGFIEQAESAEDAGLREVGEETGVCVDRDSIKLAYTQDWPKGWGGMCELMIGCIAKAVDDALKPNLEEMATVQWVHRNDVCSRIAGADHGANSKRASEFQLPPQNTIGFWLLRDWASRPTKTEE